MDKKIFLKNSNGVVVRLIPYLPVLAEAEMSDAATRNGFGAIIS